MKRTEIVAAVVVTHNRLADLQNCLRALNAQTVVPHEIVVVDNHSTDGTAGWLADLAGVRVLSLPDNRGSSGGQCVGWKKALELSADLIWAMDDDCDPSPDALEKLLHARSALENPDDWALSCLAKDRTTGQCGPLVQVAPGIPRRPTASDVHLRIEALPAEAVREGVFLHWGHFFLGSLLPAPLVREIGLPDEAYFIRGEDYEYLLRCLRRKDAGVVLDSVMFHPIGSRRVLAQAGKKLFYEIRNHVAIDRKYFPGAQTSLPMMAVRCLRDCLRAPSLFREILRAYWDGCFFCRKPAPTIP